MRPTDAGDRRPERRFRPAPVAAAAAFAVLSLAVLAAGRGERSGWILMTSPVGPDHRNNSLLGYSFLHGGEPFMKENVPCVTQVGLFSGCLDALSLAEAREDFRFIRGFYSFAAALLAPLAGVGPALLAVNWLCWAACAAVAWRFARDVSGSDAAALIAVLLVAGGTGAAIHIGEQGPHLPAFATYYVGVWLLYRTGVFAEARPLRTHLFLGAYMALACLTYNTGVMLLAAYLLASVRRNRWLHLAAAAALALSARPVWRAALGPRVQDQEAAYLSRAVESWRLLLFESDLGTAIGTILRWASEFVFFFDSPAVVLLGLPCCLLIRVSRPLWFLGAASVAMPFAAGLAFAPSATARGYLVYGASLWVYVALASRLATGIRSNRRTLRRLTWAAVGLVLAGHFAWSTAHLWHQLGPAKTYFLGWDDGRVYFTGPPDVVSITDREPTPVLFGGSASLREAGAVVAPDRHVVSPGEVEFSVALLSRGVFFAYLALLAAAAAATWRSRVLAVAGLAAFAMASAGLSSLTFRFLPAYFPVDRAVVIPAGGSLRYERSIGAKAAEGMRAADARREAIGIHLISPFMDKLDIELSADGRPLPLSPAAPLYSGFRPFGRGTAASVARAETLTLLIRNPLPRPVELAGWQRADLSDRRCTVLNASGVPAGRLDALPTAELRAADPRGKLTFVAF